MVCFSFFTQTKIYVLTVHLQIKENQKDSNFELQTDKQTKSTNKMIKIKQKHKRDHYVLTIYLIIKENQKD